MAGNGLKFVARVVRNFAPALRLQTEMPTLSRNAGPTRDPQNRLPLQLRCNGAKFRPNPHLLWTLTPDLTPLPGELPHRPPTQPPVLATTSRALHHKAPKARRIRNAAALPVR